MERAKVIYTFLHIGVSDKVSLVVHIDTVEPEKKRSNRYLRDKNTKEDKCTKLLNNTIRPIIVSKLKTQV